MPCFNYIIKSKQNPNKNPQKKYFTADVIQEKFVKLNSQNDITFLSTGIF